MGDYHVRFCERLGVKFPLPTRRVLWVKHKLHATIYKMVEPTHQNLLIGAGSKPLSWCIQSDLFVWSEGRKGRLDLSGIDKRDERKRTYRWIVEKAICVVKTEKSRVLRDKNSGKPIYWLFGNRRIGGMTFIWAYRWNAGSLTLMLKGTFK